LTRESSGKSPFVVPENLVFGAIIETRQRIDSSEYFVKFFHPAGHTAATRQTPKALFERDTNGFGKGFAGLFSDLASEVVNLVVFNALKRLSPHLKGEF
jgi:hypothetical protein